MSEQVVPHFEFPEYPMRVAVMGDWHEDGRWAAMMVRYAANLGADVIVHTGDFGIDMDSPIQQRFISTLNRALKAADLVLVFVDGNHDCVSEDTRAVTRRGFLRSDEITLKDEVLSVDDAGNSVWVRPSRVIRRNHVGSVVRADGRNFSMLMTPNHRVVGRSERYGKWVERRADSLETSTNFDVVTGGSGSPDDYRDMSDDEIRLYAWCLTDAHYREDGNWYFYQKESGVDRIIDLLDRLGYSYTMSVRSRNVSQILGKKLLSQEPECTVRMRVSDARKLRWGNSPCLENFVWKWSERQVGVFLDEVVYCDGSYASNGLKASGVVYGDSSDGWREGFMTLLVANGYRVSESVFRGNDHRINFARRTTSAFISRKGTSPTRVSRETYSGEVWCLTVPNGRFFVERGGKVFLTGNCFDVLLPKPLNEQGLRPITTRIAHLPRGFRWQWWDKTWVALGGAQSVNGNQIPHYNWWAEEVVSPQEAEAVINDGPADVMVTHDMPEGIHLPGMSNASLFRADLLRASENHHALIGMVVDEVRPELMLHGHMHARHDTVRPLPDGGETLVVGLDCNGCRNWKDNLVLLDAMTLDALPLHDSLAQRRDDL